MTTQEVVYIFSEIGNVVEFTNYIEPDWDDELGEIQREVQENLLPRGTLKEQKQVASKMLSDFRKAKLQPLSVSIWDQLHNTDSNTIDIGDFSKAKTIADGYGRSIDTIVSLIKTNSELPPPQIFRRPNGQYTLIGGNTRLMAFRALGIQPKVLFVDWSKHPLK